MKPIIQLYIGVKVQDVVRRLSFQDSRSFESRHTSDYAPEHSAPYCCRRSSRETSSLRARFAEIGSAPSGSLFVCPPVLCSGSSFSQVLWGKILLKKESSLSRHRRLFCDYVQALRSSAFIN